jgi:hypothetical protein
VAFLALQLLVLLVVAVQWVVLVLWQHRWWQQQQHWLAAVQVLLGPVLLLLLVMRLAGAGAAERSSRCLTPANAVLLPAKQVRGCAEAWILLLQYFVMPCVMLGVVQWLLGYLLCNHGRWFQGLRECSLLGWLPLLRGAGPMALMRWLNG